MANHYVLHTDGGARGNPGPAAIGVVIEGLETGKKEYAEYIGNAPNNVAEYRALVFGLKKLKLLAGAEKLSSAVIECYSDSELMVSQLNGEYKVKESEIQKLFLEVWNLQIDIGVKIKFIHIPREKNAGADALVNAALDKEASKLAL